VADAVASHLAELPRGEIAAESWRTFGAIIEVESLAEAVPLVDRIAPEHLELQIKDYFDYLGQIRNAGAVFLGPYTPEPVGDYVAGPNHVLPTARRARFSSGLSVLDFVKRTTLVRCDAGSLAAIGPAAMALAREEGLDAHARSIACRIDAESGGGNKT